MQKSNKPFIIGCGGYARSGKDTFVKIARKIAEQTGYITHKAAFADALKNEVSTFIMQHYGINVWTEDSIEKSIIRPLLVAHGCQKRLQTKGRYWIDKIDEMIEKSVFLPNTILFISDCRFPNEVDWVHNKWNGWFVHLKKYSVEKRYTTYTHPVCSSFSGIVETKTYDKAPNEEEAKNDPICEKNADFRLELENMTAKEERLHSGIKITPEAVLDNTYLNKEIKLCLMSCPFLTIK